jgi:DNA-binding NtrC family response regulator
MSGQPQALRILIVEDDPGVILTLSRWLTGQGFLVRSAGSAEEGIEIASRERLDLIMTDLCLPGMSGFAAIGALRGEGGTPVLVMTGYADEAFLKDALCFGAIGLIEKPFDFSKLMSCVRGVTAPH